MFFRRRTAPKTTTRCPRCEFSYAWDGKNCGHCHLPFPTRANWAAFTSLVRFDYAHPKRDRRRAILVGCAVARRVQDLFPVYNSFSPELLDLTEQLADGVRVSAALVQAYRRELSERVAGMDVFLPAQRTLSAALHAGLMSDTSPTAVETGFREAAAHARAARGLARFPNRPWKSFPLPPDLEDVRATLPDTPPMYHQYPDLDTNPRAQQALRELSAASHEYLAQRQRAEQAEESAQCGLYRDVFGYPFAVIEFKPEWRTSTTLALARQMYESRDFSGMPILADALQDAGCAHDEILEHCRGGGEHVRGCWVVDRVLKYS